MMQPDNCCSMARSWVMCWMKLLRRKESPVSRTWRVMQVWSGQRRKLTTKNTKRRFVHVWVKSGSMRIKEMRVSLRGRRVDEDWELEVGVSRRHMQKETQVRRGYQWVVVLDVDVSVWVTRWNSRMIKNEKWSRERQETFWLSLCRWCWYLISRGRAV